MSRNKGFAFGTLNYLLMIAGIVLIAIGLIIMTMDEEQYGFGVKGLTIGPVTIMLGFVLEFFAIFIKSKAASQSDSEKGDQE